MTADDDAYGTGVLAFNTGQYYEAHEHWERVWILTAKNDPERRRLQALIQIAAGAHKFRLGVPSGTKKLFRKALDNLTLLDANERQKLNSVETAILDLLAQLDGINRAHFESGMPKIS